MSHKRYSVTNILHLKYNMKGICHFRGKDHEEGQCSTIMLNDVNEWTRLGSNEIWTLEGARRVWPGECVFVPTD